MSPGTEWILGLSVGLVAGCIIAAVQALRLPRPIAIFLFVISGLSISIATIFILYSPIPKEPAQSSATLSAPLAGSNVSPTPLPPPPISINTPANIKVPRPPVYDVEQIESEVSSEIYSWKSNLESHDINALMDQYADVLDFYYTRGTTLLNLVRDEKQKAFDRFDNIRFSVGSIQITSHADGERAIAVFDKGWSFSGSQKAFSGKVQSQLLFKKINGRWRIAGEKDLETYFVNK